MINVDLEAEENYSEILQKWVIFVERISLQPCAYLSHGLSLNVPFEDLFGPGGHSEGRLDLLIVLTHEPKLNVFVAELGLQEGLKYLHTVYSHTANEEQLAGAEEEHCLQKQHMELVILHLEERSLSNECDHCDISSKESLQKGVAASITYE